MTPDTKSQIKSVSVTTGGVEASSAYIEFEQK